MPGLPGVRCEITNHSDREQIIALGPTLFDAFVTVDGKQHYFTVDANTIKLAPLGVDRLIAMPERSTLVFQAKADSYSMQARPGDPVFAVLSPIRETAKHFDYKLIEEYCYAGPKVKSNVITWP